MAASGGRHRQATKLASNRLRDQQTQVRTSKTVARGNDTAERTGSPIGSAMAIVQGNHQARLMNLSVGDSNMGGGAASLAEMWRGPPRSVYEYCMR